MTKRKGGKQTLKFFTFFLGEKKKLFQILCLYIYSSSGLGQLGFYTKAILFCLKFSIIHFSY